MYTCIKFIDLFTKSLISYSRLLLLHYIHVNKAQRMRLF